MNTPAKAARGVSWRGPCVKVPQGIWTFVKRERFCTKTLWRGVCYLYIYMYICMYVYEHMRIHIRTHAHVHTRTQPRTHAVLTVESNVEMGLKLGVTVMREGRGRLLVHHFFLKKECLFSRDLNTLKKSDFLTQTTSPTR